VCAGGGDGAHRARRHDEHRPSIFPSMALQRREGPHGKYMVHRWHAIQQEALFKERALKKTCETLATPQDKMSATCVFHSSRGMEQHVPAPGSRFCIRHSGTASASDIQALVAKSAAGQHQVGKPMSVCHLEGGMIVEGAAGVSTFPTPAMAWTQDVGSPKGGSLLQPGSGGSGGGRLVRPAPLEELSSPKGAAFGGGGGGGRGGLLRRSSSGPSVGSSSPQASQHEETTQFSPTSSLRRSGGPMGTTSTWGLGSPLHQHEAAAPRQHKVPRTDFRGSGRAFTLVLS